MKRNDNGLLYGPEDKVSYFQSGLLGLQHVLAMDVYVPPIIIAGLLSMSLAQNGLKQFRLMPMNVKF